MANFIITIKEGKKFYACICKESFYANILYRVEKGEKFLVAKSEEKGECIVKGRFFDTDSSVFTQTSFELPCSILREKFEYLTK